LTGTACGTYTAPVGSLGVPQVSRRGSSIVNGTVTEEEVNVTKELRDRPENSGAAARGTGGEQCGASPNGVAPAEGRGGAERTQRSRGAAGEPDRRQAGGHEAAPGAPRRRVATVDLCGCRAAGALRHPVGEAAGVRPAALPEPAASPAGRAGWQAPEAGRRAG